MLSKNRYYANTESHHLIWGWDTWKRTWPPTATACDVAMARQLLDSNNSYTYMVHANINVTRDFIHIQVYMLQTPQQSQPSHSSNI